MTIVLWNVIVGFAKNQTLVSPVVNNIPNSDNCDLIAIIVLDRDGSVKNSLVEPCYESCSVVGTKKLDVFDTNTVSCCSSVAFSNSISPLCICRLDKGLRMDWYRRFSRTTNESIVIELELYNVPIVLILSEFVTMNANRAGLLLDSLTKGFPSIWSNEQTNFPRNSLCSLSVGQMELCMF